MRHRSLLEILIVYTVVEAALWTRGHIQFFWIVLAAICVGIMTVRGGRSAVDLGLSKPGWGSARILGAAFIAAMAIIGAGWTAGTLHALHGRHSPVLGFIVSAAFAFAQEFVLQSFFFVRLQSIFPTGRAAVVAAAV